MRLFKAFFFSFFSLKKYLYENFSKSIFFQLPRPYLLLQGKHGFHLCVEMLEDRHFGKVFHELVFWSTINDVLHFASEAPSCKECNSVQVCLSLYNSSSKLGSFIATSAAASAIECKSSVRCTFRREPQRERGVNCHVTVASHQSALLVSRIPPISAQRGNKLSPLSL